MTTNFPPTLLCDFYKVSHREQYPAGTEYVYSTWIPRGSRIPEITEVVTFGMQAFVQKYLVDYFNDNFFNRSIESVLDEYERVIKYTLGVEIPDSSHIKSLWELGYLPLEIKALHEGTLVPLRVPIATVENTSPEFFWLTNYIETLFSVENWMATTSATHAWQYRKILTKWAKKTGGDLAAVPFQGHDFSMRGMSSVESAAASGAGHLLSFTGTDTIPSIIFAEKYYGANIEKELIGASIPATEHSVMCAYGQDELSSYGRIINDIYPGGFVSIVSDTWDLWKVLTETIPQLKEDILKRDGRVVIRPDSGDPVEIICGSAISFGVGKTPSEKGVIEVLWDTFGGTVNEKGYKVLDPHIGAIYGDSITEARCEAMCARLSAKGFASTNIVLGIGSFTYQYNTRDTFAFAMKSTAVTIDGVEHAIFKDPATDDGTKKSLTGRVIVSYNEQTKKYAVTDGLTKQDVSNNAWKDSLRVIFRNGQSFNTLKFSEVREALLERLE